MSVKNRVYGIDLGTTYSCIASVDDYGQAVVHPNSDGDITTPSVVFFEEGSGNIVVGSAAKEEAVRTENRVVATVKRVMGTDAIFSFDTKNYTTQDISSFILRRLVQDAQDVTGGTIKDVVITCPAYFGFNEKEATKQAGELAGLNVLHVIPEPTAAAIAYGINQKEEQTILVYDLGGGTFDITLIETKENAINVIATDGNKELGGKDWDEAIVAHFAQLFEDATGVAAEDVLDDAETHQQLQISAEKCKRSLTKKNSIRDSISYGSNRVQVEFSKEKFEELTIDKLEQTLALTEKMISDAKEKGNNRIDKLLLVGGATYMPQVEKALTKFGIDILRFDPNQAVAKGAAIFGYKFYLDEQIKITVAKLLDKAPDKFDMKEVSEEDKERATVEVAQKERLSLPDIKKFTEKEVFDITSKSFGIVVIVDEAGNKAVNNLAVINERVPKEIVKTYGTHEENQTGVNIVLMQNEEEEDDNDTVPLENCEVIDTKELIFEHALPKGSPIEVTFRLEADGRLTLKAIDQTTSKELQIETTSNAILSQEQLKESLSRNLSMDVSN